ncbi:MAG TPA: glycosyltransferase [Phycisphaerae bacterium]|nr:glycosyltransferase [Phycisphaerae bacterium]HRW53928.1 glycosyltransferase [Phycisphaerae bacterium]
MQDYRLLLVAYHFPPIAGSGVQRALKLAKYLPKCGLQVHVLTCAHTRYPLIDDSLLHEIDDEPRLRIHRVRGLEPASLADRVTPQWRRGPLSRAMSALQQRVYWRLQSAADRWATPEPEQWWIGSAIRAARRLHATHPFDAILTTSPPHSMQRVGVDLQRVLQIPWIADLRDPIVDNFAYAPKDDITDRYWRSLERDVLDRADHVVTTCPDYTSRLAEQGAVERLSCITNGYDEADRPARAALKPREAFTLSHVGAFYHSQSVAPLLGACRAFRRRRPDARLTLRLVGSVSRQQATHFEPGDDTFTHRIGYQSHTEATREMAGADALFLMTPSHANGRHCIPAKFFEYLAFGGRIIALVHRGSSVERIARTAGGCATAYHDDVESLTYEIERAYDAHHAQSPAVRRDASFVESFRRDRLATEYADLIASCVREARLTPMLGSVAT